MRWSCAPQSASDRRESRPPGGVVFYSVSSSTQGRGSLCLCLSCTKAARAAQAVRERRRLPFALWNRGACPEMPLFARAPARSCGTPACAPSAARRVPNPTSSSLWGLSPAPAGQRSVVAGPEAATHGAGGIAPDVPPHTSGRLLRAPRCLPTSPRSIGYPARVCQRGTARRPPTARCIPCR